MSRCENWPENKRLAIAPIPAPQRRSSSSIRTGVNAKSRSASPKKWREVGGLSGIGGLIGRNSLRRTGRNRRVAELLAAAVRRHVLALAGFIRVQDAAVD